MTTAKIRMEWCITSIFLASDKYMRNHGYSGFDSSGVNSKIYDTAYFKKVTNAFDYRGSYWVFMNNSGIYKRAHISSGKAKCLLKVKGSCFIKFNSNKYYYTAYNRLYIFNYKEKMQKLYGVPLKIRKFILYNTIKVFIR